MKEIKISEEGIFNIGRLMHGQLYQTIKFMPEVKVTPRYLPNRVEQSQTTEEQSTWDDYRKYQNDKKQIFDPPKIEEFFCNQCMKSRVFKVVKVIDHLASYIKSHAGSLMFSESIVIHEYSCSGNEMHLVHFIYKLNKDTITKIGQLPVATDLQEPPSTRFKKLLGKDKASEYYKSIQLNKLGYGIGAFVHLRRILEKLIEDAHLIALVEDSDWDEVKYQKGRQKDKIKLLHVFLPKFFVEHRNIYSILSLGIHELNEEQCRKYFNIMKQSIDAIINDKITMEKKKEEREQLMKEIQIINRDLNDK